MDAQVRRQAMDRAYKVGQDFLLAILLSAKISLCRAHLW